MAGLSTSLNYSAYSADASRLAITQQLRGQEDVVATQLRNTFGDGVPAPGTTITAKYQYKVGADGALYPIQTRITSELQEPESALNKRPNERRSPNRQQAEDHSAALANISRPRPQLDPSDELALFSVASQTRLSTIGAAPDNALATVAAAIVQGEGEDADGAPITTEILPPQSKNEGDGTSATRGAVANITARAQQAVSGLYARNSNVVYNVNPQILLAA